MTEKWGEIQGKRAWFEFGLRSSYQGSTVFSKYLTVLDLPLTLPFENFISQIIENFAK